MFLWQFIDTRSNECFRKYYQDIIFYTWKLPCETWCQMRQLLHSFSQIILNVCSKSSFVPKSIEKPLFNFSLMPEQAELHLIRSATENQKYLFKQLPIMELLIFHFSCQTKRANYLVLIYRCWMQSFCFIDLSSRNGASKQSTPNREWNVSNFHEKYHSNLGSICLCLSNLCYKKC